jgi:hypothetical protein
MRRLRPLVLAIGLLSSAAQSALCQQWSAPETIANLDTALIGEASGIAASRIEPGRLYHINDSGDGPFVYVTDAKGAATRKVRIAGFDDPQDVEDIAVGPCAEAASCLFVGDIGDNLKVRPSLRFAVIAESQAPGEVMTPARIIEARYPDGAHDAESFAIHPNGDLFLITKPYDFENHVSHVARIFRLSAAQLAGKAGEVQTFSEVGAIDLPYYLFEGFLNQVATAMDIAPDGSRTLILTYRNVFEWEQDLAGPWGPLRGLRPGKDFVVTPIARLPQAEAITYADGGDTIIYSSEQGGPEREAPLVRQRCARR